MRHGLPRLSNTSKGERSCHLKPHRRIFSTCIATRSIGSPCISRFPTLASWSKTLRFLMRACLRSRATIAISRSIAWRRPSMPGVSASRRSFPTICRPIGAGRFSAPFAISSSLSSPSMRRSLNRCTTLAIFAALSIAGNALACSRLKAAHSSRARSIACTQLPTRA